jgi:cell division protein FtsL
LALLNRTLSRAEAQQRAFRIAPLLLVAGVVVVAVAVAQLLLRSEATTATFEIRSLEQQRLGLETEVRQLEAEVASLSALARVEREAKRLGLGPPVGQDTVQVNVAWEGADQERLPTRFARDDEEDAGGDATPWWQDMLDLLPFQ